MALLRYALNDHPDVEQGKLEDYTIDLYHESVVVRKGIAETGDPLSIDILIADWGFELVEDQDEAIEAAAGAGDAEDAGPAPARGRRARRQAAAPA